MPENYQTDPIPADTLEQMLDNLTAQVAYLHQTIMENSARPVAPDQEPTTITLSTEALETIIQTALAKTLRALPEGSRSVGFIEVSPITETGALAGPKISVGSLQIVAVASLYRKGHVPTYKRLPNGRHVRQDKSKPIGSAIRLTSGKLLLVREYYQRVLWLLYKARRSTVANYVDERDNREFRLWATETLGWDLPAWVHEYDDCNYVHPNDQMAEALCEKIDEDGKVTFSDGSRGVPGVHNNGRDSDILFRQPTVKLNADGDILDI